MKNTLSRVSFIVHEKQKFQVSDRLLCTISGGQDSILNLVLFYHLEALYFFEINLAYCNHFWQPTNFYTLFELLKFSYLINKPMSNTVPKRPVLSEEEAHFWRQKNFYQIGTYLNLNNIITGHSLTDQIETSFWHFVRGSGPIGLISLRQNTFITNKKFNKILAQGYLKPKAVEKKSQIKFFDATKKQKKYFFKLYFKIPIFGRILHMDSYTRQRHLDRNLGLEHMYLRNDDAQHMSHNSHEIISNFKLNTKAQQYIYLFFDSKKSRIKVRRPLLSFSRTTIGKLIKQNQLPRIIDTTNQSQKLVRNKVRLILIPLLQSSLQIKFQRNINKYLNIIEEEQIYFSILEKNLLQIYLNKPFEIKYLYRVPLAIKRSIVKTLLERYMSNQVIMNYIMHIINFK